MHFLLEEKEVYENNLQGLLLFEVTHRISPTHCFKVFSQGNLRVFAVLVNDLWNKGTAINLWIVTVQINCGTSQDKSKKYWFYWSNTTPKEVEQRAKATKYEALGKIVLKPEDFLNSLCLKRVMSETLTHCCVSTMYELLQNNGFTKYSSLSAKSLSVPLSWVTLGEVKKCPSFHANFNY